MQVSNEAGTNFLIEQLAKMVFLDLSITEGDRKIIQDNDDYRQYYEASLQEFRDMKVARFYDNLSVYNICLESERVISGFAKNEELVEALEDGVYDERFPIYFPYLKKRFYIEVERHRLRRVTASTLSNLFQFNDPRHIINQKIFGYMKDEDLAFLLI